MCEVLEVSPSGYYAWRDRKPSAQARHRERIARAVAKSHQESYGIYGYRKVYEDVVERGLECCRETVRRVMRKQGLWARQRRAFVITTDSGHDRPVAPNVLAREFSAKEPNEKWVGDITYIRTEEGWLYLAAVLDLFSRRIVGWAMSDRIDAELTCRALNAALRQRLPGGALLHHSDRGSQYASEAFAEVMDLHGIECSMSRKGNVWDNSCMERFFCSLKTEWTNHTRYRTREEARQSIFEYIELFYNRKRRHEALGYASPEDFEEAFKGKRRCAA